MRVKCCAVYQYARELLTRLMRTKSQHSTVHAYRRHLFLPLAPDSLLLYTELYRRTLRQMTIHRTENAANYFSRCVCFCGGLGARRVNFYEFHSFEFPNPVASYGYSRILKRLNVYFIHKSMYNFHLENWNHKTQE